MVKFISNVIHLIDPLSGQMAQLSAEVFWRDPIRPLITAARSRMTRYIVLGKEPVFLRQIVSKRSTSRKQRSHLASLTLVREDDLGVNECQFEERSHVGYLMKSGDVCVGYDLKETQFVDDEAESMRSGGKLPDVVIIRKLYGGAASGEKDVSRKRNWQLQRLDVVADESLKNARNAKKDEEADDMDEEDFMREVEADREMRLQMNIYKSSTKKNNENYDKDSCIDDDTNMNDGDNNICCANGDDDDDIDDQEIKLEDLLDGLVSDNGPDPDDDHQETL